MTCKPPSSARPPASRRLSSALCLCLALWLSACAAPAPIRAPADPPPANLAADCDAGPAWPTGDTVPLGQLLDVAAQREAAGAECRARHRRLVEAWPR